MYSNLLSVHNLLCLWWNNFVWMFIFLKILWPWKLAFSEYWMEFFSVFVSLMTYLGYMFFTRCICFYHNWWWERKKSILIFEGFYLKLRRKFRKFINTVDSWYHEYSKNQTTYKLWRVSDIKLSSLLLSAQNSQFW